MKKEALVSNLTTAVLTLCAVVITLLVVRRELGGGASATEIDSEPVVIRDWQSYATGTRKTGAANGVVTIVEFSDFECPFCRLLASRLDSLRALYPQEVSLEYRHYPLSNHPNALAAARASDCAEQQGRFWPMHAALFENQALIGRKPWTDFAAAAGIPDSARFARCMERGDGPLLRDDLRAAERLGVRATPTLLINEHRVVGVPPLDTLRAYVARARGARTE